MPTLVPSNTPLPPTATPADAPLPPTATPTPPDFGVLPPTWTPTDIPTNTPVQATATSTATIPVVTPLGVCNTFTVDRALTTVQFTVGAPVSLVWTPVTGAEYYTFTLLRLDARTGQFVIEFTQIIVETSYLITPQIYAFDVANQYGWQVYPNDPYRNQMCLAIGGELMPVPVR